MLPACCLVLLFHSLIRRCRRDHPAHSGRPPLFVSSPVDDDALQAWRKNASTKIPIFISLSTFATYHFAAPLYGVPLPHPVSLGMLVFSNVATRRRWPKRPPIEAVRVAAGANPGGNNARRRHPFLSRRLPQFQWRRWRYSVLVAVKTVTLFAVVGNATGGDSIPP